MKCMKCKKMSCKKYWYIYEKHNERMKIVMFWDKDVHMLEINNVWLKGKVRKLDFLNIHEQESGNFGVWSWIWACLPFVNWLWAQSCYSSAKLTIQVHVWHGTRGNNTTMKTSMPIYGKCDCSIWLAVNVAAHDRCWHLGLNCRL